MFYYSKTIKTFIARVREDVREIINLEMNLKMDRSRVLYNGILYPLNILKIIIVLDISITALMKLDFQKN